MQTDTRITIRGFVVGPIWWPVGEECYKPLHYDLTDNDSRFTSPGTLRDHILRATNDGDFQSCQIALGELQITRIRRDTAGAIIRRTRSWPLDQFPSIADCLYPDPDWTPSFGWEE